MWYHAKVWTHDVSEWPHCLICVELLEALDTGVELKPADDATSNDEDVARRLDEPLSSHSGGAA